MSARRVQNRKEAQTFTQLYPTKGSSLQKRQPRSYVYNCRKGKGGVCLGQSTRQDQVEAADLATASNISGLSWCFLGFPEALDKCLWFGVAENCPVEQVAG